MIRHLLAIALLLLPLAHASAADRFGAAVADAGRSADDRKRDAIDHPDVLLRMTGLKPGDTVLDVLGAEGYFSELASDIVGPQGRVLLLNNKAFDDWSPALGKRLAGGRLPNVTHQVYELNDMHLQPDSVDVVLLVKVYHDLYWVDPTGKWPKINVGGVLDQLHRALKPGGRLLLVDHSALKGHGKADAGSIHRIEESFAIADFRAHGFTVASRSDVLRQMDDTRDKISYKGEMVGKTDRFVLVFRKN